MCDIDKHFDYENDYYLTAPVNRIGKFVSRLEIFKKTQEIAGEIVECGVFKGVSLSQFVKLRNLFGNSSSKKIIAFDTFNKFPMHQFKEDEKYRDAFISEAGNKSITRAALLEIFEKLGISENIELVEGNIIETVPQYTRDNKHLKISLLHIDVDLY